MPNPEQKNANITKDINKLTTQPDNQSIRKELQRQMPDSAWQINLAFDAISMMRPLTQVEEDRIKRWVMFWEKTYWEWINDSIPAMSSEELEKWKTNAKLKLEEFSKMWTAFGDVVSSEEAKESVEKLSDAIVKFGAAITYVTTMFSGKMMIKFRPEIKLALDSAILIFQQSIADIGAGALTTVMGPFAVAPKLLFNAIQAMSKSMQFTAVALQGLTEAGFLTALGIDQGLQPFLKLMKSVQEAIDSMRDIVNDTTKVLNQEPPTPEVMKKVTEIEMSMSGAGVPAGAAQPVAQPPAAQPVAQPPVAQPPVAQPPVAAEEEEVTVEEEIENIKNSNEINFTGTLDVWKGKPGYKLIKAAADAKALENEKAQKGNILPNLGARPKEIISPGGFEQGTRTSLSVTGGRKTLKKRKKKRKKRKSRKRRKSRKSRKY